MELANAIKQIAKVYGEMKENIQTEQATKMSLIAPLIQALGYNIFDPSEVVPEYIADVGSKKGEKIDYAILSENKPIMIMECKWSGADLTEENRNQLIRYFMCLPDTKIAILTNGLVYQFYTDIDREGQLDAKSYFQFDIRTITNNDVKELSKYAKPDFKLDNILSAASELKYIREIKRYIEAQLSNPADPFVKCIMLGIDYPGRAWANIVDEFRQYTKTAFNQFLNDKLNDRLSSAITTDTENTTSIPKEGTNPPDEAPSNNNDGIITTQDEIDAYNIIRAILRRHVPVKEISFRDTKSYSSVLYKNKFMPICRFYFRSTENLQLALIGPGDPENFNKKTETRVKLESLDDIYSHEDTLVKILKIIICTMELIPLYCDSCHISEEIEGDSLKIC